MTTAVERAGSRGVAWTGVLVALGGPVAVVALAHSGLIADTLIQQRSISWIGLWALVLVWRR